MKMIDPLPALYICGKHAFDVRNAPSRWIASSFLPVVERKLLDLVNDLDAGIGDQHVDAAPVLDHFGNAIIDLALVGDIHLNADGFPGACFRQFFGSRLRCVQAEIGNGDLCAIGDKPFGNGKTNTACCTCNDADFVFEVHGWFPSLEFLRASDHISRRLRF